MKGFGFSGRLRINFGVHVLKALRVDVSVHQGLLNSLRPCTSGEIYNTPSPCTTFTFIENYFLQKKFNLRVLKIRAHIAKIQRRSNPNIFRHINETDDVRCQQEHLYEAERHLQHSGSRSRGPSGDFEFCF